MILDQPKSLFSSKGFLSIFLLLLFSTLTVKASHIAGGDISYTPLGGNQYRITLNLFRDCSGITASSSETISINSNCGLSTSITANLTNPGGTEVSQLCPSQLPNSTCGTGSQPGMQHYIYTGVYTFASMCDSITFSWSSCCRNTSVNVPSSSGDNMYLSAVLYGSTFPVNSSPEFTAQPIPYVCANQPVTYNYGVVEADGDSLRFKLIAAKTGATTNVTYGAGYTATTPINGISINANTGQITFTPTVLGNFIVTIGVYEYSSTGVLKGFAMRDIQFVVQSCTNSQPVATAGVISTLTGSAIQTGNYSLRMCEGNTFTFTATFNDPDGSDALTLTSNITTALPGATISYAGSNPRTATVSWTATPGSAGSTNIFTISVEDNACPIPGVQTMVYDIQVVQATNAGPDQSYCPAGGGIQLQATGGTTFSWSPTTGLSCSTCPNPIATPTSTTTYIVTSNLTGSCKNKDTVIVRRVPDFTFSVTPATSTICQNGGVTITANTPDGAYAPYTYNWTPSTGLNSTSSQSPLAQPSMTSTYTVTATSSTGCKRSGSAIVNVSGVAPIVTVAAGDTTLCLGESTTLTSTVYNLPLTCRVPSTTCASPTTYTIGTGTLTTTTGTPYKGFYHDGRVQILYTKADLNAAGIFGGVIKNLAFNVGAKNSTAAYSGFTIKMGCTTTSSMTSTFETGLTTVYGPANVTPTANSWNSYTLAGNGYEWDGSSNILVEVCFDNGAYTSDDQVYYTTTSYTSVAYASADASVGCTMAGTGSSVNRPNIRFGVCTLPGTFTYAWSPAAGLSSTTIANPTATPTATTTYILNVTNTATGCTGARSVVIYVGGNTFSLSATASSTICAGTTKTLVATPSIAGSFTYSWNPSSSLSSSNTATTIASPGATTTYSVTASNGGAGCTKIATSIVTVKNKPTVNLSATDTTLCLGEASTFTTTAFVNAVNCGTPSASCTSPTSTITIGTGTTTSTTTTPYKGFYEDGRIQMLYTKAELNAQGITGGVIKTVGFRMGTKSSTAAYSGFNIKMGCTSISATAINFVSGLTTVYSVANSTPTANTWNTYTLSGNGYEWDGISNLIIEVCFDNNAYTSSDAIMYTTTSFNSVTYAQGDGNTGCTMTGTSTSTLRPNIQLGFCVPAGSFSYSWTPSTGLSSTTSSSPVMTSGTSAGQANVGIYSYSVTVTDALTGCTATGTKVVKVGNTFSLTMSPSATACSGSSTTLSAEVDTTIGTLSYYWTPATTLNNANIWNPTATPTGTTNYSVTVISSEGCSKSGSTLITLGPGNLSVSASATTNPICEGNSTALTAIGTSTPPACQSYPAGCTTSTNSTNGISATAVAGVDNSSPFYRGFCSYKRQYLYTKAEIDAILGSPGTAKVLTGLAFNITTTNNNAVSDITISIGCTSASTLSTTFNTSLTQVKTAFTYTPNTAGYQFWTFTTPYLWDGSSNLIVQVCTNTKQAKNASALVESSTATSKVCYVNVSGGSACTSTTGTLLSSRPNIKFSYCAYALSSLTYSWTPSTGLSNPAISNPTASPVTTTTYFVTAQDPGTGCSSTEELVVQVNEVDAGPDITTCSGSNATLQATYVGQTGVIVPSCGTGTTCSGSLGNTTITVGTGTASSSSAPTPFRGTWLDGRVQILYRKADLNALGITAGTIKSIAFDIASVGQIDPYDNFTIKMGCVSATALTTTFQSGSFSTVYGPAVHASALGWNTFTLAGNGFSWDGVSNLLVEVCFDNDNWDGYDYVRYSPAGFVAVSYDDADLTTGAGCVDLTAPSTTSDRPNTKFSFCQDQVNPTYSWTPAASIASGATTATPTTTNLTSTVNYIVTVSANGCTLKDTVAVTIAAPATLTWTGATSTDWFTRSNWSSNCLPECATTVTIPTGLTNYPNITAAGASCNSITIQAGGTLSMAAAGVLSVCGDFTNNGTLAINPAATIRFNNGSVNQNITGNLTGTNKLGNLMITKTGGALNMLANIDIGGTFTTSNATSICNTGGVYIKLAGNFTNSAGGTTFTNVGTTTGTLEFNGTIAQTYSPGGTLTLNKVVINHTGTGVTLASSMLIGTSGSLTLTLGKIITGTTYMVIVNNTASNAVTTGNTSSFVQGFLRRYINPTGSYDFPVGNSAKGYQRANVNFTAATTITYLTADFQSYASVPGPLGTTECSVTYNYNALDNGFWNIDANTVNNNTGMYNMTLYNLNYTNAATTNGWTVMSRHNSSLTWALVNGDGSNSQCMSSPVTAVVRNNMKGFSKFGTAQSTNVLPIELLSFTGTNQGEHNLLEWVSASELNNLYFAIERMNNASDFIEVGRVAGAGTVSSEQYYSLKDYNFENKINYYRLRQVDFSGKETIEGIVSIDNRSWKSSKLDIFPNPANTQLFLSFTNDWSDKASVEVINDAGQVAMRSSESFRKDVPVRLDISSLANGLYVVKITNTDTGEMEITRFMKAQ